MDGFRSLPVFNIESEEEDEQDVPPVEVQEVKVPQKIDHLHKLLSDRSLSSPRNSHYSISKKLEVIAEDNLLKKDLKETSCTLPGNPRSTFLMVFSPDGSKVASTHGDHNINVTDLRSNKCISTLSGHPRTPWCIAFHPHRNDILASGCLGGQVRVWDLHGGSEMWSVTATEVTTVIASLAFHPSERLLVIATNSTLYFWDWNFPNPFTKCSTANEKQKLRYVSFDPLGNWLLTGISNAPGTSAYFSTATASAATVGPAMVAAGAGMQGIYRLERVEQDQERTLQSRYQTLLDQYERLRVRYQELRHRAAELELNANSGSHGFRAESREPDTPGPSASPSARSGSSSTAAEPTSMLSASSSDRFWRTLMNAAEKLRALSNLGRSLNSPNQPGPSSANLLRPGSSTLDQDARFRIQLLSRLIENMQRICRSHLEMTRHRRQVYRLQQIRRILEDLREQIRYLQVCVRDSLDMVSRMHTTPTSPENIQGTSRDALELGRPSQSAVAGTVGGSASSSNSGADLQFSVNSRMALGSRGYSPIQCRRFAHYLVGRLRRIGLQHQRDLPRLHRSLMRDNGRGPLRRFSLRPTDSDSTSTYPDVHIDPQPGTSRDYAMDIDDNLDEEPSLERGFGHGVGWRRSRYARLGRRSPAPSRSNSLLHVRNTSLAIQRRKPSLLSRVFHGRTLQSHLRSVASQLPLPSPVSTPPTTPMVDNAQRSDDQQSLRPLMERLESQFRLQRQTMGILAQLNEAAANNGDNSSSTSGGGAAAADSSVPTSATSFNDSLPRSWTIGNPHLRHWRVPRREPPERTSSLESRSEDSTFRFEINWPPPDLTRPSTSRQVPRRSDSNMNFGPPFRFRSNYRPSEDEDSSDNETGASTIASSLAGHSAIRRNRLPMSRTDDLAAVSGVVASSSVPANRWRQSNPIRSPRGVEQRMRLLWREYLSQVVHAQSNGNEGGQQPDSDPNSDQERNRYRMWLSTMVESLTSFFSQHGINSAEGDPTAPVPSTSAAASLAQSLGTQSPQARMPGTLLSSPSVLPVSQATATAGDAMREALFGGIEEPAPQQPRAPAAIAAPAPEEGRHRYISPILVRRTTPGSDVGTPWRIFPRYLGGASPSVAGSGVPIQLPPVNPTAAAGAAPNVGNENFGPGQQRWNLRRNAESQVSLSAHLTYRIQAWDFCSKDSIIPDIRDPHANVVVPESKIHNDASVDVSSDGRFLVTLVPCTSLTGALISLHSLEPSRLGMCLAQVNVDQFVVSVSISPTCRHLLLGLASSRALSVASRDHAMPTLWAQVYQIPSKVFQASKSSTAPSGSGVGSGSTSGAGDSVVSGGVAGIGSSNTGGGTGIQLRSEKKGGLQEMLLHTRDLSQTSDAGMTSLNCIRWIPTAGQGFVLGTNKGHLKVIH